MVSAQRPLPPQLLNFAADPGAKDDASTSTLGSKSRARLNDLEAQLAALQATMSSKPPEVVNQVEDDVSMSSIESDASILRKQAQKDTFSASSPAGGAPPGASQSPLVAAPAAVDQAGQAGGGDPPGKAE